MSNETLVKTLSVTSTGRALHVAEESVFEIRDVQEIRDYGAVVITDDEGYREHLWQPHVMEIFRGYEIPVYPFVAGRKDLTELALKYVRG